jgi:hypothetical protein
MPISFSRPGRGFSSYQNRDPALATATRFACRRCGIPGYFHSHLAALAGK